MDMRSRMQSFISPSPSKGRQQEERGCNPATIGNHCASLLYPAKLLHREHAPDYQGNQTAQSTTEAIPERREEIVAACGKQRDLYELTAGDRNRARECCNLVILGLYSYIPPS
ncbi:hypothetical protein ACROYT_G020579 [Oculina patagonica]